jgi:hypothetical protein
METDRCREVDHEDVLDRLDEIIRSISMLNRNVGSLVDVCCDSVAATGRLEATEVKGNA